MIAPLLLSACLLAAPAPAQPSSQTDGATTGKTAGSTTGKTAGVTTGKTAGTTAGKTAGATTGKPADTSTGTTAGQKTAPAPAPTQAAAPRPGSPQPPKGLVVIETHRGRLEFSHKEHAKLACDDCHKGQAPPARLGVKGVDAAHKYCVDCHRAAKQGPDKCSWCHKKG